MRFAPDDATFDSENDTVEIDIMYDNNIYGEYGAEEIKEDTINRSRVSHIKKCQTL